MSCALLHRSKLKHVAKSRYKINDFGEIPTRKKSSNNLHKRIYQIICQILKIQLDDFVNLEMSCKIHICLQKSVPTQPKTEQILAEPAKIQEGGVTVTTAQVRSAVSAVGDELGSLRDEMALRRRVVHANREAPFTFP